MKIESRTIKLKNIGTFSTEYFEEELKKQKINPIRWAVIKIEEDLCYLNVAYTVD